MDEDANKIWYLQQNRLFLASSFELVEDAQHLFKMKLFPKRSRVFDDGDPARLVYLVKRGTVRLARLTGDGKEVTIALLRAGDLFGEEALLDGRPRTTIAICMEETLICTAIADDLFALVARDPNLALNVAKVVNDRLGDASAAMEDLAYASVADRIVHALVRLAGDHGVDDGRDVALDVRLTHGDIASLVGSTRETVSLEMARLQRAGRLRYEGQRIVLVSAERPPL